MKRCYLLKRRKAGPIDLFYFDDPYGLQRHTHLLAAATRYDTLQLARNVRSALHDIGLDFAVIEEIDTDGELAHREAS